MSMGNAAPADAEEVLAFWFGTDPDQPLAMSERWFTSSAEFDAEVRARFGPLAGQAAAGELDAWLETPRGTLALVILLDQFSRNLHRDSPVAFAQDARARRYTELAVQRGHDAALTPVQRWFLVMPWMHAEELAAQERCIAYFDGMLESATGEMADALRNARNYGLRHREVIARFRRFPHRNTLLGRETTPAEAEWLREHPSGF